MISKKYPPKHDGNYRNFDNYGNRNTSNHGSNRTKGYYLCDICGSTLTAQTNIPPMCPRCMIPMQFYKGNSGNNKKTNPNQPDSNQEYLSRIYYQTDGHPQYRGLPRDHPDPDDEEAMNHYRVKKAERKHNRNNDRNQQRVQQRPRQQSNESQEFRKNFQQRDIRNDPPLSQNPSDSRDNHQPNYSKHHSGPRSPNHQPMNQRHQGRPQLDRTRRDAVPGQSSSQDRPKRDEIHSPKQFPERVKRDITPVSAPAPITVTTPQELDYIGTAITPDQPPISMVNTTIDAINESPRTLPDKGSVSLPSNFETNSVRTETPPTDNSDKDSTVSLKTPPTKRKASPKSGETTRKRSTSSKSTLPSRRKKGSTAESTDTENKNLFPKEALSDETTE